MVYKYVHLLDDCAKVRVHSHVIAIETREVSETEYRSVQVSLSTSSHTHTHTHTHGPVVPHTALFKQNSPSLHNTSIQPGPR